MPSTRKPALKPLSKILKSARDKSVSFALLLVFDAAVLGSALANYHRFGIEGLLWATALVVLLSVGALYMGFGSGSEDWPKRD